MGYQSDIYTALTGNSALAAIVSNRIYPDIADSNTAAPFIVYQAISTGGENSHDGERDYVFVLIQFSCWAKTKKGAVDLAKALANILDGNTISGNSDCSFQFANQSSTYEVESRLFGETLEYTCAALT